MDILYNIILGKTRMASKDLNIHAHKRKSEGVKR